MKTIKEWQKAAYELAVAKGFHDCRACEGTGGAENPTGLGKTRCPICAGTGRADPHKPARIASRLALIHCEISEAVECVARGNMKLMFENPVNGDMSDEVMLKYNEEMSIQDALADGYKPEGFPVELADVFLRVCDLAESLGLELRDDSVLDGDKSQVAAGADPESTAAGLCMLHDALPCAYECDDARFERELGDALSLLSWIAAAHRIDLLAMAELKHEYNKTRPIRHGGKTI